jgi:hypothetical protein
MSGRPLIRDGADRYLVLMIVSYIIAVVGTRWYLQLTGYPQIGGGELHIAHMLWGGLALIVAVLVVLLIAHPWAVAASAILAGAGTGLFIDEVGKFITSSNDYFYPVAAPLIYGLLLVLVLVYVLVARRPGDEGDEGSTSRVSAWEAAHLTQRRYRRLLVAGLLLVGLGWTLTLGAFLAVGPTGIRVAVEAIVSVPGDPVVRPSEPLFYWLEAAILGLAGLTLLGAAVALGRGRESGGVLLATVGLVIALTAGAIVSFYVEQMSAITSALVSAGLLLAVVHYGRRFVDRAAPVEPADPASMA